MTVARTPKQPGEGRRTRLGVWSISGPPARLRRIMRRQKSRPPGQPPAKTPASSGVRYDPDEPAASAPALTVREEEICFWVVRGKENEEIARILDGNAETVRKHVENIREKFKVESRLALLAAYWQREVDRRDRRIAELERRLKGQG